jgi:hypothetical protein
MQRVPRLVRDATPLARPRGPGLQHSNVCRAPLLEDSPVQSQGPAVGDPTEHENVETGANRGRIQKQVDPASHMFQDRCSRALIPGPEWEPTVRQLVAQAI